MNDTVEFRRHDCLTRIKNAAFMIREEVATLKEHADDMIAFWANITSCDSRMAEIVDLYDEADPKRPSMSEIASQMGKSLDRLIACLRAKGDPDKVRRLEHELTDIKGLSREATFIEDYGYEFDLPF